MKGISSGPPSWDCKAESLGWDKQQEGKGKEGSKEAVLEQRETQLIRNRSDMKDLLTCRNTLDPEMETEPGTKPSGKGCALMCLTRVFNGLLLWKSIKASKANQKL